MLGSENINDSAYSLYAMNGVRQGVCVCACVRVSACIRYPNYDGFGMLDCKAGRMHAWFGRVSMELVARTARLVSQSARWPAIRLYMCMRVCVNGSAH